MIGNAIGEWVWRALGLAQPFPLPTPGPESDQAEIYNYETALVMERVLDASSCCVDVGCHEGSILDLMMHFSPGGRFHAFEPLPYLFAHLQRKYQGDARVSLHEAALADTVGETTFQHVVTNPGFSGIRPRRLECPEEVREIRVRLARLDDLVPRDAPVRLVKVDVEGAELGVFQGGIETLRRCRPYVVFEHGWGGSDFYGTRPEHVHELLAGVGLSVSTMADWLAGRPPLSSASMARHFDERIDYYYLAHP